jgi:hypothetical protein
MDATFGYLKNQNKSMPFGIIPPPAFQVTPSAYTYYTAVQMYTVVTVSLTAARTVPTAIGNVTLPDGTVLTKWAANSIVVSNFPGGASMQFGLGNPQQVPAAGVVSGVWTASSGFRIDNIPFTQLYIQNTAQSGVNVELTLAWND